MAVLDINGLGESGVDGVDIVYYATYAVVHQL